MIGIQLHRVGEDPEARGAARRGPWRHGEPEAEHPVRPPWYRDGRTPRHDDGFA